MNSLKEQERTIQNMKDAGCSEDTINRFLRCYEADDVKGGLRILSGHRRDLLDQIHNGQKKIDCLDYLVYQIEKSIKQTEKM